MKLSTMAAVMSFVTKIETQAASFYEAQAARYPELQDTLLKWAKENRKFEKQVKQTYFGVITDTLESNYSFESLDTDNYPMDTDLPEGADATAVKAKVRSLEETIKGFYEEAARLSEGLMADIPRLFKRIAKKREERFGSLSP